MGSLKNIVDLSKKHFYGVMGSRSQTGERVEVEEMDEDDTLLSYWL